MAEYPYNDPNVAAPPPDPREAIQEVLRAIKRNMVRVTFTVLVALMIGYALSLVWPSKFESGTEFVLNQTRFVSDVVANDLREIPLPKKLQTLENELKSRKRIDKVMADLQWVEWLETAGKDSRRKDLRDKVKDNLFVSMEVDTRGLHHISIKFRWTRPSKAAQFVNSLRDHWISLTLDGHRKNVEDHKERLEGIVAEREANFQGALSARQKFQQENNVPQLMTPEVNNQLKAEMLSKLTEAKVELDASINVVERLEGELSALEPQIKMPPQPKSPEHAAAMLGYSAAEQAFSLAKKDYTERNPTYQKFERAFLEAEAKLKALGPVTSINQVEMQTNPRYYDKAQAWEIAREAEKRYRAQVTRYEEELDAIQGRLDAWPMVAQEMQRLDDDVRVAEELIGQAKIEVQPWRDQVSQLRSMNFERAEDFGLGNIGPFEILEPGVEPEKSVLPVGALIMAFALIAGLTIGVAGPILGELTRSSYGSVKEVSRNLGVPVLGAVDLILTSRDQRARLVQQALSVSTMVLVLAAMGTALYIYTNLPDVLPASIKQFVRDMKIALT